MKCTRGHPEKANLSPKGNIEIEVGIFKRLGVGAEKVGLPFGSSPQNDLQYQWVVEVTGGHQRA